MHDIYLKKLTLENYRNFDHFELEIPNCPIIITGENGIGKTNILESISLFYPGKGLRSTKFDEICKVGHSRWVTHGLFLSKLGTAELKSQYSQESPRRIVEFNNSKIPSSELSKFVNIIWLTPQTENIFYESSSSRRKFFDRIVYNFYPQHAAKINEYEYYVAERSKLLQQDEWDRNWLKVLEEKIAGVSIVIAESRLRTVEKMQVAINELICDFPKAILKIEGDVESKMQMQNSQDCILYIQNELAGSRIKDKLSKRTNFGVHRSDLAVVHLEKNKLAKFCSTGEQKAMLISIILAQVNAGIIETGAKPILLLDEIFVHLDDMRKNYLIDFFKSIGLQIWITATDLKGIEALKDHSEIVDLQSKPIKLSI